MQKLNKKNQFTLIINQKLSKVKSLKSRLSAPFEQGYIIHLASDTLFFSRGFLHKRCE